MNCPNCGALTDEDARFCMNCGAPLGSSTQASEGIPSAGKQTPAIQETPVSDRAVQPEPPQGPTVYRATQPIPPQAGAPVPPAGTTPQPGAPKSNGKAIAALVCGIAAIVLSGTVVLGVIAGVIAIVLGVSAAKQADDGKAKAGKICGIIGTALSVAMLIGCVVTGSAASNLTQGDQGGLRYTQTDRAPRSDGSSSSGSSKDSSSSKSSSGSNSSSATASAGTYENKRFGYSLKLPSGFTKVSESANGDGASFENSSLNMKVEVFGENNTNSLAPEQLMETWWKGAPETTREIGSNYILFAQAEGNTMHLYYAHVGAGSIDQMEITYPIASDNSEQLDAAEALVDGFQAGSIAASH